MKSFILIAFLGFLVFGCGGVVTPMEDASSVEDTTPEATVSDGGSDARVDSSPVEAGPEDTRAVQEAGFWGLLGEREGILNATAECSRGTAGELTFRVEGRDGRVLSGRMSMSLTEGQLTMTVGGVDTVLSVASDCSNEIRATSYYLRCNHDGRRVIAGGLFLPMCM